MRDVLFIHAFPLDGSMWRGQILALRGRYRMLAPSLPGFGATPLGNAQTLDDYAEHVVAELDRAGMRRPAVCGLSMGGYIAFALWRRHAERVGALILADTRAEADSPEAAERRRALADQVRENGAGWLAANLPPLLSARATEEQWERVRAIVRGQPAEGIARASLAIASRPDSRALLDSIDVPTRVIVGELDAITPPPAARAIAEAIRGAQLIEIPGAGHLANLEAPEGFARAASEFLG